MFRGDNVFAGGDDITTSVPTLILGLGFISLAVASYRSGDLITRTYKHTDEETIRRHRDATAPVRL